MNEELEMKMKKELKSQHRGSLIFIALGITLILIIGYLVLFQTTHQTSKDLYISAPIGSMIGFIMVVIGCAIWTGPLIGPSIKQKYEKLSTKPTDIKKEEKAQ